MSETRTFWTTPVSVRDLQVRLARSPNYTSPVRRYVLILAAAQALAIVLSGIIAKYVYINIVLGQPQPISIYLIPTVLLALTVHLFFQRMNLDDFDVLTAPTIGFGKIIGGLALAFLVLLGLLYLAKVAEIYSRGWILSWFALSAVSLILTRWAVMREARRLAEDGSLRIRAALYGTPEYLLRLRDELAASCPQIDITGLYVPENASDAAFSNGTLRDLERVVSRHRCDQVILALPPTEQDAIKDAINELASYRSELLLCTDLETLPLPTHGTRTLGAINVDVVAPVAASENNQFLKRALDYSVALVAVLLLAPLFAVVAIAIKLDSSGPVFFRQRRFGRNNKIFRIFKFRTMTVTEDGDHVQQAQENDPRVTRVGRILRATSIDEIPQLLNVLLGHMSIVGPRPHALAHDREFEQQLDLFGRRRRVLPGITGWAQVHGFRGETKTLRDIRQRMNHDLYYIDNWSIWLDIEIIVRTFVTVVRGAY